MYMQGLFNLEWWDQSAEFLIFDDIEWEFFPSKKQFMGGQRDFNVTDKYRRKRRILAGMPTIYIMNFANFATMQNDKEWESFYFENSYICFINNKMF